MEVDEGEGGVRMRGPCTFSLEVSACNVQRADWLEFTTNKATSQGEEGEGERPPAAEEKRKRKRESAKMYMWTVGYSVGDMVYIAQTTADQQQANRVSKVFFFFFLSFIY
jgi:hypothetical protein